MTMKSRFLVLLVVLLLASLARAAAYDFSYAVHGDAEVRPVQVFDDGGKTYFQLKGSFVPVFVAKDGDEEHLVQASRTGQLLSVPAVAKVFQIRYGNLLATVRYVGAARATKLPEPVKVQAVMPSFGADADAFAAPTPRYGPVQPIKGPTAIVEFHDREILVPFQRGNTALTKDAARRIQLGLVGPGTVERVLIVGRDDAAYVEGVARARGHAIRDRVIAAGVPVEKVIVKEMSARDGEGGIVRSDVLVTWAVRPPPAARVVPAPAAARGPSRSLTQAQGAAAAPAPRMWAVRKADETVERMLSRWAADAGWKLVWRGAPAIAITGDLSFESADFLQAVEHVIKQSQAAGHRLRATAHPNQWLVISGD